MSQTPPPSLSDRLRKLRLDPAALPIAVAAVVLVGAVAWLLARPLPPAGQPAAAVESALAELRAEQQRLAPLAGRVAALEALSQRIAAIESRGGPDLAPLETRLAAAERAARELAARPAVDPATLAPRAGLESLGQRVDGLAQRAEAAIRQEEARATASSARIEGVARELATRLGTGEASLTQVTQRVGTVETALTTRIAALETALAERGATVEAQAARIVALEGQAQRLAALEGRSGRMATLDALRAGLEAGVPLGGALGTLANPPAALTRFATAAPPTLAALRLGFEDAARAARAASDPGLQGQGVLDSAVSRLSGLVTVRRGEAVLFGDAANAEIEKARRALEAGDIEGALAYLGKLSAPAREAMKPWTDQAESLVAARTALRTLAAG